MVFQKIAFTAIAVSFLIFLPGCGNGEQNGRNMHNGGMMQGGRMGSGGMMGGRQQTMGDSAGRYGPGQSQGGNQYPQQALTLNQARQRAEEYLQKTGNSSLKLGSGTDRGAEFEFPLLRRSDSEREASLLVNKSTGSIRSRR